MSATDKHARYRKSEKGKALYKLTRSRSLAHYHRLKDAITAKHGAVCAHCGHTDPRVLQIDHVNGGGSVDRRSSDRFKFLKRVLADTSGAFQLLCANCNWIKRLERENERGGRKPNTN